VRHVEWDGSLETGHATVDRQHQTLIAIFNEFVDACDVDCDVPITDDLLLRLSDYVSTHFAAEESLMARYDYPQDRARRHQAEHLQLSERTRGLVLAHHDGASTDMSSIAEFMQAWLTRHILETDRELANHIRVVDEGGKP
jgi:hemerythrin-like metal-binding protein